MTNDQIAALDDKALLVAREIATVNAYGYGSYRYENQAQNARFQEVLDALSAEARRRGLVDAAGYLTLTGKALDHESDPRVAAKQADNANYFNARFGTGAAHTSPYGERYGR